MESIISRERGLTIKGIAISLIICQHVGQAFHIAAVNPLGPIGVFLFLFMSGYGLTCSFMLKGRKHYIANKLKKVYIPYAFSVVIYVAIQEFFFHANIEIQEICSYLLLEKLPQGSHWYMQLILLWYIAFWFLSFVLLSQWEVVGTIIASVAVLAAIKWNISAIWQLFSFPLGITIALHQQKCMRIKEKMSVRVWGGLVLLAGILEVLKKTPYVEARELGLIDTILQIAITFDVSVFILVYGSIVDNFKFLKRFLVRIGELSYELYLGHVLLLDYLKGNPSIINLLIFTMATIIITTVIVAFERITRIRRS